MGVATPAEWRWRLLGYLQLLQGDPIDRLTVRPTLLDLRIETGTDFWKKFLVSRVVSRLFMS